MIWHLIGAGAWIAVAVAFWKYVLYPIAISKVPVGDTSIGIFGAFWAICTLIFAVYIVIMGEIATRRS